MSLFFPEPNRGSPAPNSSETSDTQLSKEERIRRVTLIGLLGNIVLSFVKLAMGIFGNSQAVVADAMHSFSDTFSDLVILFGVRYWSAPADGDHHFGHHRLESLVTIVIGCILLGTAGGIGYRAIVALFNPPSAEMDVLVVLGPLLSLVVKEWLFRITYKEGLDLHSTSLKANAWHHRTDALSSIPVIAAVGACLIDPKLIFLDAVGALVVAVLICKVAQDILFTAISELLDTSMSDHELAAVKKTILNTKGVQGVHKIRTRTLGGSYYIDLHLEVDGDLTVRDGHTIARNVRFALLNSNSRVIDVMVHMEPHACQECSAWQTCQG